ncbi:MAG: flagellar basal body-associated FliL family protein [Syntrophales bacterium]|jgi:flagellar basal body-associated protein FliL
MARKVDLDLLEELDISCTEGPREGEGAAGKKRGWKWLTGKKLIVTAILFTFFCVIGVSLMIFRTGSDSHIDSGRELVEVRSIPDNIETLDNFIIDLTDEQGHYRVLVCDITIVMDPDKNISANKLETRKKAYDALKNKGKYALISSKSYSIVRREMRDELDHLLGGGIKEVYFTRFMLL